jgi:hypothetical protein
LTRVAIAKGKDHKQYEYGNKVSIVSTKDTNIIVGVASHDPHTGDVDGALRSAFFAKTDGSGICPTGFNVPTEAQLKAERDIWDTTSNAAAGAFNSVLKLPVAGARIRQTGKLGNVGLVAYLWTRSVMPTSWWYRYARYLGFGSYNLLDQLW